MMMTKEWVSLKAGNTTKIHMAAESNGMPIEFEMTGGEVHECKIAVDLIAVLPPSEYTIADKRLVVPRLVRGIQLEADFSI